jgi:hypothetical protein
MTISLSRLLAQRERLLNRLYKAQMAGEHDVAKDLTAALNEINSVLTMIVRIRSAH